MNTNRSIHWIGSRVPDAAIVQQVVSFVAFFLLSAALLHASASYSDNFEASTINSFWTVTQQYGTVALSNALNHTPGGNQSLSFNSTYGGQREIFVSHQFGSPVTGDFSVWFYDAAPNQETQYEQIELYNSVTADYVSIGTQDFDAFCYEAQMYNANTHAQQGPNANCGVYPQISTTNISRTSGWHHFDVDVGASSTTLGIDGVTVFGGVGSYSYDNVLLFQSGPYWRPNTGSFWDDFSYHATSTPEPGTLLLLGTGVTGIAGALRRKLKA